MILGMATLVISGPFMTMESMPRDTHSVKKPNRMMPDSRYTGKCAMSDRNSWENTMYCTAIVSSGGNFQCIDLTVEVGLGLLAVEAGEVADEGQDLALVGQIREVALTPVGLDAAVGGQHQRHAVAGLHTGEAVRSGDRKPGTAPKDGARRLDSDEIAAIQRMMQEV